MNKHAFKVLIDKLKQNTISDLALNEKELPTYQMPQFSEALKHNTSLKSLSLINLSNIGAKYIADALKVNQSLDSFKVCRKSFDTFEIEGRNLKSEGIKYLASALMINRGLTSFGIEGSKIGGMKAQD